MKDLMDLSVKFRDERNWKQFHNFKDLALSLSLESSELLEHAQWKNGKELEDYVKNNKEALGDEVSDVLHYLLLISHDLDIDIEKSFKNKMLKNEEKYPVEKAFGSATKYTDL